MKYVALAVALSACSPTSEPQISTSPSLTATAPNVVIVEARGGVITTSDQYGLLRIGMNRAQADAAVRRGGGQRLVPDDPADTGSCQTFHIQPMRSDANVEIMFEDDHVARVSLYTPWPRAITPEGVGVGSTGEEVLAAYPDALRQPAFYDGPPGYELVVWIKPQIAGYRFEIGADGKVQALHLGGPAILYAEGCS